MFFVSVVPAYAKLLGPSPHQGTPSDPPPGTGAAMWIEQDGSRSISFSTADVDVGDMFNVTVFIRTNWTSTAWQFLLSYNSAYLNATRCNYTNAAMSQSLFFDGQSTIGVLPTFAVGSVLHAESLLTGTRAVEPNGKALSWIEFNVTDVPDKGETINFELDIETAYPSDTYYIRINPNPPPEEDKAPMDVYNCPYTFTWAGPPSPHLGCESDQTLFDMYTNWTGHLFDERIYIYDLAAAWYLVNVSFTFSYNAAWLEILSVDLNTVDWNGTITDFDGTLTVFANTTKELSEDVLIVTLHLNITAQGIYPDYYESENAFSDEEAHNHSIPIPLDDSVPCPKTIQGFLAVHMPHLEVVCSSHSITFGPEPVIGTEFKVNVTINRLHFAWELVGLDFRLMYCDDMLEVVNVEEGDYLAQYPQDSEGTFFISYVEPNYYGPHIVVGALILPNSIGEWPGPFPGAEWGEEGENGTIATITFKITDQDISCDPIDLTCNLELFDILMIDKDGDTVPYNASANVDGLVTVLGSPSVGRLIDAYGGAVNRGYGGTYGVPFAFPAPFGGQGQSEGMDLVIPQSVVYLFGEVMYNCWPVQSKEVGFEIEGPFEQEGFDINDPETWIQKNAYHVRKYANVTDEDGIAWIKFQMPWPCQNPQDYFGKYVVTTSVDICGVVVTDILVYDYYYLIEITKVTVQSCVTGDEFYYYHEDYVCVTIDFKSKAQQEYPVLFSIVIQDELETHFGSALIDDITVSGAKFCTWKEYATEEICIYIPKWAFAGFAHVYVSAYDKDPTVGGAPWAPTFGQGWPPGSEVPEIYILPAALPTVYIDPEYAKINVTAGEYVTFKAIVSGGIGPYTYQWYVDGYPDTWTSSTLTIYSASPGIHTIEVVVTDAYGYTCTAEATLEIEV